ncbi:MAG: BMC domain-containing protein [Lachnospiraceae bacterium]|nr:BMC domain-containing protein [Lachnospiraceae bacterium]
MTRNQTVGMLEVYGLATAFAAADAGLKAADVTLLAFDKNKPANAEELPVPLIIVIKFCGSVSDVNAALLAASEKANELAGVLAAHAIPSPESGTGGMLKLGI